MQRKRACVLALSYNFKMRINCRRALLFCFFMLLLPLYAQEPAVQDSLTISTKELSKVRLWEPYSLQLQAAGGIEPYEWRVISGALPPGMKLIQDGMLTGELQETGSFQFTALVKDNDRTPKEQRQEFVLDTEAPLVAEWDRKAQVNGDRIDGSIKVSNQTGRDFDLTFVVLAVNDIGRATAIGYQHFSLSKDTRDMVLPFGDTLSPGNYVTNVDVVGEESISQQIFRVRLVTEKQAITQGP